MQTSYKYFLYAFLILLALAAGYKGYQLLFPPSAPAPVYLNPNLETQREREVQRDTVIKWYEKIIYKQSEPEIVYVQKIKRDTIHRTDSILITRYRSFDLITKLDKSGNNLIVKTYNDRDSLLKEYTFSDVYNDFTITSQTNNLFVKTNKLQWDGLSGFISAEAKEKSTTGKPVLLNLDYRVGLSTGYTFQNKLSASASAGYDFPFSNSLFINLNLKVRLK